MSLARLRLAAARHALGLFTSEALRQVADEALDRGVYSHSLGELATTRHPILSEVGPLFEAALKELGVPLPSAEAAARSLTQRYLADIAEGACTPLDGLRRFATECYGPLEHEPFGGRLADSWGWPGLLGPFHEAKYLMTLIDDGYLDQEEGEQALAKLGARALELASRWCQQDGRTRLAASWFTWNGGAVRALARTIDEGRSFEQLPVLADALEDAGCTDDDILEHCREAGGHVRCCWVVDAILAKS
jgi:hypothetical protein